MEQLINEISSIKKKRICAKVDNNGKLLKNIANCGITAGKYAIVKRNGLYYGLTIQVLSDVKPLLTTMRVCKVLQCLTQENIIGAKLELCLQMNTNTNVVYYILKKWLDKNNIKVTDLILDYYEEINDPQLDEWIYTTRDHAIPCKLKIIDVGQSKGKNPVVPESWVDREFESADKLHEAMNDLEWRTTKVPVNYCCTYGMAIKDDLLWGTKNDVKHLVPHIGVTLDDNYCVTYTDFNDNTNDLKYNVWLENVKQLNFLVGENEKYVIACNKYNLFRTAPIYKNVPNVGVLVSRLQKSIRRGPTCRNILLKTISELNYSKPYNLPEQKFIRVSGTKQLLWRLFITIIEDVCAYDTINNQQIISLSTILILAIICHNDSDLQLRDILPANLQHFDLINFKPQDVFSVLENIMITSCHAQACNTAWNWRKGNLDKIDMILSKLTDPKNKIANSLKLALSYIPMMQGDRKMLTRSINYLKTPMTLYCFNSSTQFWNIKCDKVSKLLCLCAANDMHCYPNIILLLQSSLPFIDTIYETHQIPRIIWDYSSRINFRYDCAMKCDDKTKILLNTLNIIQKFILENNGIDNLNNLATHDKIIMELIKKKYQPNYQQNDVQNEEVDKLSARTGFLSIFGKKERIGSYEIIVAGTREEPCRVKKPSVKNKYAYLIGKERFENELKYVDMHNIPTKVKLPDPPFGYQWICDKKVLTNVDLVSSDDKMFTNQILFHVNNYNLQPFDTSPILKPLKSIQETIENEFILNIIKQALYVNVVFPYGDLEINLLMRRISYLRTKYCDYVLYKWTHILKECNVPNESWRILLGRLISLDEIFIGPIDRTGNRINNAISYKFEGLLWRLVNMLAMLYPMAIKISGTLKFVLNKNHETFNHIIKTLQCHLANITYLTTNNNINIDPVVIPTIKTKLWDHQQDASNKVYNSITNFGRKGHCDASCVGSGKTLTALSVASKLICYDKLSPKTHSGILVLLPSSHLYDTWINEINKHTENFSVITQQENGELSNIKIVGNTIILTTLGRMRDHPIIHPWLFVVVDECTKVCNTTLQTEEAWRQSTNSKYGVLLMSASLFTSRFEKLFYMLKMLKSGIPENTEYLDTILSEHMICCVGQNDRKWITNVNKFQLGLHIRIQYDKILSQKNSYEKIYLELSKLLHNNCDYTQYFKNVINKINKEQNKALIYAKSKIEADIIAETIHGVSRYPENSKTHMVISYAEGTYGLNSLIKYNTIITRPPEPNILPQIKGRLDRPGQNNNVLKLEYVLTENTIEEASLVKLEMASNFYHHHIMPLAEFYKLAIDMSHTKDKDKDNFNKKNMILDNIYKEHYIVMNNMLNRKIIKI